jgi:hypothetical protein
MSFALLHLVTAFLTAWGLTKPAGLFQFPALVGMVLIGFVLPQVYGLHTSYMVPDSALLRTEVMASLCGLMCLVGYGLAKTDRRQVEIIVNYRKMDWAIGVLTAITVVSHVYLFRLPKEVLESPWSGAPVAYNFFAQCLVYAFALSALVYAETRSRLVFGLYLVNGGIYLWKIVLLGRRGSAAEFLVILFLSEWFRRRRKPSNAVILAGIGAAMVFSASIASYREMVSKDGAVTIESLRQIQFTENLSKVVDEGGPEMTNAAYDIEATVVTGEYDLGAFHWNALIFNYVPAQLVGAEFKSSLLFELSKGAQEAYGHQESAGSTSTGIADAFRSFGYLGCLKFLGIGYLMGWLYRSAMRGHWRNQVLVMILTTPAVHTMTHHTQWIVSPWVHMALFLFPALGYATKVVRTGRPVYGVPRGVSIPVAGGRSAQ